MLDHKEKHAFIFLHAAKSGGSSFWHSLAATANENPDIFICDAYHESQVRFGCLDQQNKAAALLIQDFLLSKKNTMLMHRHGYWKGSDILIPKEVKRTYILLIRDANSRLRSCYKWYLQTKLKQIKASNLNDEIYFFDKWRMSWGYNRILPLIFNKQSNSRILNELIPDQISIITLEDYNLGNLSYNIRELSNRLNIKTPKRIIFKSTVTSNQTIKPIFPLKSNKLFWNRFKNEIIKENEFNSEIIKRFYSKIAYN